jgi:tRNA(fMet)-specific endonuclease VapC
MLDSTAAVAAERQGKNARQGHERRQRFLDDLLTGVPIQPITVPIALRAGQIDGQGQARGVRIPLSDLLIGASALELSYSVGTANTRHFHLIPGLNVIQL